MVDVKRGVSEREHSVELTEQIQAVITRAKHTPGTHLCH